MAGTYNESGITYDQLGSMYENWFSPAIVDPNLFNALRSVGEILLAEFYFEGGRYVQRVATDWWYSQAEDSIGVKEFASRIISEPNYELMLGCFVWGSKTTSSVGAVEVADPAGELDWMQRKVRDSICVLRLALPYQRYDETEIVGRYLVDSVEMDGMRKLVNLRGIDTLLDRPLQAEVYESSAPGSSSSSSSSSSTSSEPLLGSKTDDLPPPKDATGNESIEGESIPVTLGDVYQMEPVLVSAAELIFQITDLGIIDIDAVMSGGSVANPPGSSGEDWAYAYQRTSFQMAVDPSARITANVSGIRALTPSISTSLFYADDQWSSDGPEGWLVSLASSDCDVTLSAHVGARLTGGPVGDYGATLSRALALSESDWVVVVIDVADITDGYLVVDLGNGLPKEIKREGKHAVIGLYGTGLTIAAVADSTGADVTIGSVYVYGIEADIGTNSLVEMMRHITIARGAIPDAEAIEVELINGGNIPSSDYVFTNEFGNESLGYYMLDEVSVGSTNGFVIQGTVGDEATLSYFRIIWPNGFLDSPLVAGRRYRYSIDISISDWAGSFGTDCGIEVYFRPTSLSPSGIITLENSINNDGNFHTYSGDFVPAEDGSFIIAISSSATSFIAFQLDNISLKRLDYDDTGATIDFNTLLDVDDGYEYGFVSSGNETVREVAQRLLDSFNGWLFANNEGRIEFGKLQLPSGPVTLAINSVNMRSIPVYKADLAPGLSDTVAAARNWSPYTETELAGITYPNRPPFKVDYRAKRKGVFSGTLARQYTHAIGAEPIPTLLSKGEDAQLEANRLTSIYSAGALGFWEVEIALESALAAAQRKPGAIYLLDDPLFAQDEGKIAVCVGVGSRYRSNVVKIILWGATNG